MHENGVLDGHDALLALDRRSQPLRHAEQPEVGHAVVKAELSRDPRRNLRVRVRRILPAVLLRVEGEAGRGRGRGRGGRGRGGGGGGDGGDDAKKGGMLGKNK